jgi:hypothetical protein
MPNHPLAGTVLNDADENASDCVIASFIRLECQNCIAFRRGHDARSAKISTTHHCNGSFRIGRERLSAFIIKQLGM